MRREWFAAAVMMLALGAPSPASAGASRATFRVSVSVHDACSTQVGVAPDGAVVADVACVSMQTSASTASAAPPKPIFRVSRDASAVTVAF